MQKKEELKLYGFKLKGDDIVDIFNHTDLIGYEKDDNGKWFCNGGIWLVRNPHYIINSFYDFYHGKYWESLTENEFNEIVANDDDLKDYDCKLLSSDYPIEKLFNMTVEVKEIANFEDVESYPSNATFAFLNSQSECDEPCYLSKNELLNGDEPNITWGKCRVIY